MDCKLRHNIDLERYCIMEITIIVVGIVIGLLSLVIFVPIIAALSTVASVAAVMAKEDESEE
ncbi:MAG: hypothetical protein J6A25_14245 [Lachnospiraceae bacterium]|nr:hypothetical protein [Lachnospiraceae bacterium]